MATNAPMLWIASTDPLMFPKYQDFKPRMITEPMMKIDPKVVHFVPA
jgi:hypothetical protein